MRLGCTTNMEDATSNMYPSMDMGLRQRYNKANSENVLLRYAKKPEKTTQYAMDFFHGRISLPQDYPLRRVDQHAIMLDDELPDDYTNYYNHEYVEKAIKEFQDNVKWISWFCEQLVDTIRFKLKEFYRISRIAYKSTTYTEKSENVDSMLRYEGPPKEYSYTMETYIDWYIAYGKELRDKVIELTSEVAKLHKLINQN